MDARPRDFSRLMNGIGFDNQPPPFDLGPGFVDGVPRFGKAFMGNRHSSEGIFNHIAPDLAPSISIPSDLAPISTTSNLASIPISSNLDSTCDVSCSGVENLHDDYDFSDSVLIYINQILMEEDVENKGCMLHESLELQAAEKSLYDVIGKKYPPSPDPVPNFACQGLDFLDDGYARDHVSSEGYIYMNSSDNDYVYDNVDNHGSSIADPSLGYNIGEYTNAPPVIETFPVHQTLQSSYSRASSNRSSNSASTVINGYVDSPISTYSHNKASELCNSSEPFSSLFNKGFEEANKFLPEVVNVNANGLSKESKGRNHEMEVKFEEKDESGELSWAWGGSTKGRKHLHEDSVALEEERSFKQAAIYPESTVRSDMFDKVLLSHAGDKNEAIVSLREILQTAASRKAQQSVQSKGSGGVKGRGKKQSGTKDVIDLRTLLTSCAQAVAADDRRTASDLLKQIRQHSSPFGDGNQRLAHCFADGLEARMAGTGTQIYKALTGKRTSAADVLKAYLVYLAACPFRKLSQFFSNKTISKLTRNATRIHIIDFGILYGFQWPTFFQCQASRQNGPPRIKITGIDFPQPGFRPAERVEETGRRLANYAEDFKVPFEYNAIAKKWETIQVEDLKLEEGEVLIVSCLYRMKNLPDETMMIDSARNTVLNMIRKIQPDIFINGVINGAYSAPFFVTRFKEALFHFSSHFDMLETIVPRECSERILIERDLLGKEALNVVACEGWERVERPETYKQWQVRIMRAGFKQLPLDPEIKNKAIEKVRTRYHKDFVIGEDSRWLLQGWKGRIVYALSTWKPV
uniref:GRAS4 n=1 Tax=Tamarix hispida TaxID=189793 RepID=A0A2S1WLS3_9CARY|nr:GRAS4 [Tamarix hispida]